MDDESAQDSPIEARTPKVAHVLGAKAALGIAALFFVVQVLAGVGVGIAAGVYLGFTDGATDSESVTELMAPLTLPIGILGVVLAGLFAFRITRRFLPGAIAQGALASLGWRSSPASQISKAAFAGCVLAVLYLAIVVVSPPTEGQQVGPLAAAAGAGGWSLVLWAILALLLAPPIEEFIFRGVLLCGLSNALGVRTAAVIVTILFMMVHATEALGYWPAWVGIGGLASTVALIRIKTDSLGPAIAAHAGYNLVLVVVAVIASA